MVFEHDGRKPYVGSRKKAPLFEGAFAKRPPPKQQKEDQKGPNKSTKSQKSLKKVQKKSKHVQKKFKKVLMKKGMIYDSTLRFRSRKKKFCPNPALTSSNRLQTAKEDQIEPRRPPKRGQNPAALRQEVQWAVTNPRSHKTCESQASKRFQLGPGVVGNFLAPPWSKCIARGLKTTFSPEPCANFPLFPVFRSS